MRHVAAHRHLNESPEKPLTPTTFALKALGAAALILAASTATADGVTDALGDYVAGDNGSKLGDLDVTSSFVTYNPGNDSFVFSGSFAAAVGTTPGGFYVWDVNRGDGTAGLATQGLTNVLFGSVVIFDQDGAARITGTNPSTLLSPAAFRSPATRSPERSPARSCRRPDSRRPTAP